MNIVKLFNCKEINFSWISSRITRYKLPKDSIISRDTDRSLLSSIIRENSFSVEIFFLHDFPQDTL